MSAQMQAAAQPVADMPADYTEAADNIVDYSEVDHKAGPFPADNLQVADYTVAVEDSKADSVDKPAVPSRIVDYFHIAYMMKQPFQKMCLYKSNIPSMTT